jgi:SAM-dependent methyltransferase
MAFLWLGSVFSSSFLLFLAQPLLAKWLLPRFGGSPSTWTACMLFFQLMLLAGYAYAHGLARLRAARLQFVVHALFALIALGWALGSRVLPELTDSGLDPSLRIPALLLWQAGPPFLLISSTAPLLQRWAALLGAAEPHRLYAISNAGSLLALIAYPCCIEAALPVDQSYALWCFGLAAFALAVIACALVGYFRAPSALQPMAATRHTPLSDGLYWAFCACVPSVFLLAVTNHISVDIAVTPALWLLPLGIYLLSFIAAFGGMAEAARGLLLLLFVLVSLGLAWNAFAEGSATLASQLGFSLAGLGLGSLLCHAALVRARPAPERLTAFYLWIAAGGALGGAFVSLFAARVFDDYYELELATLFTYSVLWLDSRREARDAPGTAARRRLLWLGFAMCLPLLSTALIMRTRVEGRTGRVLERRRSFLGALRVSEFGFGRILTHGRIRHGMQLSDSALHDLPTMYFGQGTALARVLEQHAHGRARSIGVVGLGVGTIAAYGGEHDRLRFYELDPNVLDIAQHWFSFLKDSRAQSEFALGDGRLLLQHEPSHHFDILVLDAFASDAVPVHLLTREAFAIYLRQLAPDGVLLANVSNRHLAVDRVVRASARASGLACQVVETQADAKRFVSKVRWAIMARDTQQLSKLLDGLPLAAPSGSDVAWTDARASLWSILR